MLFIPTGHRPHHELSFLNCSSGSRAGGWEGGRLGGGETGVGGYRHKNNSFFLVRNKSFEGDIVISFSDVFGSTLVT